MSSFSELQVSPHGNASYLPLSRGESLVFCNGLGGRSVRADELCGESGGCPWFASKVNEASAADLEAAVLFCRYHVQGNPRLAHCYLKDTQGRVWDQFTIDVTAV